jgi:hypothetical protein
MKLSLDDEQLDHFQIYDPKAQATFHHGLVKVFSLREHRVDLCFHFAVDDEKIARRWVAALDRSSYDRPAATIPTRVNVQVGGAGDASKPLDVRDWLLVWQEDARMSRAKPEKWKTRVCVLTQEENRTQLRLFSNYGLMVCVLPLLHDIHLSWLVC